MPKLSSYSDRTLTRVLGHDKNNLVGKAQIRELLTGARIYYVGFVIGTAAISIATPAVATLNAHGLSANNQVVFSVLRNTRQVTLSVASPCVATLNSHGLLAGQPVQFSSTGWLPSGVVAGTTYYVLATGLTTNTFQFSTSPGGAAVNSAALTNTFVNGNTTVTLSATHNLAPGQIIQFSGTSVVNVANATNYYVLTTPGATTLTFGLTADGAAIVPGVVTTQGTFVQNGTHFNTTVGSLPTGVTEGQAYYVISAGLTVNAFEFSATLGGSAINTSGSVTGSPVYSVRTGSDANDGLTNSIAGALLTPKAAHSILTGTLDFGGQNVTVTLADGTYLSDGSGASIYDAFPWSGSGSLIVLGNVTLPCNVNLIATSANCMTGYGGDLTARGFRVSTITSGMGIQGVGGVDGVWFGACAQYALFSGGWGIYVYPTTYLIEGGGALAHLESNGGNSSTFQDGVTVYITGVPAYALGFCFVYELGDVFSSAAWVGGASGPRFAVSLNAVVNVNGAGINYFPGTVAGSADTASGGRYG